MTPNQYTKSFISYLKIEQGKADKAISKKHPKLGELEHSPNAMLNEEKNGTS
jgi:hypothetical protein